MSEIGNHRSTMRAPCRGAITTNHARAELAGHPRHSLEALREAVRVNPEEEESPFLIRLYF